MTTIALSFFCGISARKSRQSDYFSLLKGQPPSTPSLVCTPLERKNEKMAQHLLFIYEVVYQLAISRLPELGLTSCLCTPRRGNLTKFRRLGSYSRSIFFSSIWEV